jgi:hypothetical protein
VFVEVVPGPFQALDHGAFAQDAGVDLEELFEFGRVHGGSILFFGFQKSFGASHLFLYRERK